MSRNGAGERQAVEASVREAIYRACLLLDEERFMEWLALCAPDFCYRIRTYRDRKSTRLNSSH